MLPGPGGFFQKLGEAVFLEPGKLMQLLAAEFDECLDLSVRDPRKVRACGIGARVRIRRLNNYSGASPLFRNSLPEFIQLCVANKKARLGCTPIGLSENKSLPPSPLLFQSHGPDDDA